MRNNVNLRTLKYLPFDDGDGCWECWFLEKMHSKPSIFKKAHKPIVRTRGYNPKGKVKVEGKNSNIFLQGHFCPAHYSPSPSFFF